MPFWFSYSTEAPIIDFKDEVLIITYSVSQMNSAYSANDIQRQRDDVHVQKHGNVAYK
jgi:hypothetical protein